MKRIKLIYTFLLALAFPLLTACSNDDAISEGGEIQKDGKITVHLRVSQAAPAVTRAGGTSDKNAEEKELMNIWTVVITNSNNEVVNILSSIPTNREIDPINYELKLNEGTYHFYSFANIAALNLAKLLGFVDANADSQDIIPEPSTTAGEVVSKQTTNQKFPAEGKSLNDYTAKVNGNKFNVFSSEKDNGFGSYGIPMSNHQTFEVTEETADKIKDLIVVRMLAKIELQIYNDKGKDVEIESITLTDITKYVEGTANLKLFPRYNDEDNADKMEAVHGDIQPNLSEYTTEDVIITLDSEKGKVSATTNNSSDKNPVKITFYVNESATPDRSKRDPSQAIDPNRPTYKEKFYHFFLEIKLKDETKVRYALIDDKRKDDGEIIDDWGYIARNDYRIIPIVLDDYKLDMIPYDFPAIGVLPASMKEEDGIYTINFHDYGHFHLVPQVTKYSDGKTVPYIDQKETETTIYWTLGGATGNTASQKLSALTSAWGSWTDASKSKEKEYKNDDSSTYPPDFNGTAFYKTGYSPAIIKDGDDVGGEPVWYQNTNNENPTWSADEETYYGPFIFGYINKHPNGTGDRKVYHEFSIDLYKGNTAPRQMTYRLYMILDEEQMFPVTSRGVSAPRCPHHWH